MVYLVLQIPSDRNFNFSLTIDTSLVYFALDQRLTSILADIYETHREVVAPKE